MITYLYTCIGEAKETQPLEKQSMHLGKPKYVTKKSPQHLRKLLKEYRMTHSQVFTIIKT